MFLHFFNSFVAETLADSQYSQTLLPNLAPKPCSQTLLPNLAIQYLIGHLCVNWTNLCVDWTHWCKLVALVLIGHIRVLFGHIHALRGPRIFIFFFGIVFIVVSDRGGDILFLAVVLLNCARDHPETLRIFSRDYYSCFNWTH